MMTTPSGWRAVPVRLTSEQIAAMQAIPIGRDLIGSKEFFDQHHAAMLAAAPSPPSAEPLQPGDEMVWRNPAPHAAPPSVPSGRYREGSIGPQQPSPPPSDALREALTDEQILALAEKNESREVLGPAKRVSIAELEALLASDDPPKVEIQPDGLSRIAEAPAFRFRFTEPHLLAFSRALLAAPSAGSAGQADKDRIAELEKLVYVPGVWRCPKCNFRMVSATLHADSGRVSANTKPQDCANGCGPMWRVTEREAGNDLADRLDAASGQAVDQQARRHAQIILQNIFGWNLGITFSTEEADEASNWLREVAGS